MNSTPLKSLEGITSQNLVKEAANLAELVLSWKLAGQFKYDVPQCPDKVVVDIHVKEELNNDYWVARVNEFEEVPNAGVASLWKQLLQYSIGSTESLDTCHTVYEEDYIEEIFKHNLHPYELPEPASGYHCFTYLTELFYKLQWPLKVRRFCNLVHIVKSPDEKRAFVISLAVDPSLIPNASKETHFVDGQFTSVERLEYDGEDLQWLMTTCSDANGMVPGWIAKKALNSAIAKDVPSFMNWALKKKE